MKILIVNFDHLGDVVFSSYIADAISRWKPSSKIDVLCSSYTKEIATCYPGVNEIYHLIPPWRSIFKQRKGRLGDFINVMKGIREIKYDLMICASPHWKDVLAARITRAERHIGFAKRFFVLPLLSTSCNFPEEDEPIMEAMLRLVKASFPDIPEEKPRYRLVPKNFKAPAEDLHIVLHPFSADTRRTWPLENWILLADQLRKKFPLRWIGSQAELENLQGMEKVPDDEIFFEKIRVLDTIKLFANTRFFVGHNSGPTHIACGLGLSGLALYPRYTTRKYFPQGVGDFKVLECGSMQDLKVEEVLAGVLESLAGST